MNADDLTALNEQIAAMARAGLPLDQGLQSLAREMGRGTLRTVTEALAQDLRAGHPLPEALARQQGRIPPYYACLVTAGIQTGRLPDVLATLATYSRTVAATRSTVIEALFYPSVILVIGLALFAGLAVYVLPLFEQTFQQYGLTIPDITEVVLLIGHHVVEIFAVLAGFSIIWIVAARSTSWGGRVSRRIVDRMPIIGTLLRSARLAAFTDLLAVLVEHGTPLPNAFRLAGEASSDPGVSSAAKEVEAQINLGRTLGDAIRGRGLLPDWVAWLAMAGERQGALAATLREVAVMFRKQVDIRAAILRTVLPPLIIVSTAGILVFLLFSGLMTPMIKLLEGLSK